MADDAGFAVAVTIRERLLNDALQVAYAGTSFPRTLSTLKDGMPQGGLPGGPPADIDFFLGPPKIDCHEDNTLTVSVEAWGQLFVTMNGVAEAAEVDAYLAVSIQPAFVISVTESAPETDLTLSAVKSGVTVPLWDFSVLGPGGFTPAADSYLRSDVFRGRLEQAIKFAVLTQNVSLPKIDISFLGSSLVAALDSAAVSRVRQGVVLIGLNLVTDDLSIIGDVDQLSDFAHGNDIAAVTNRLAVPTLLQDVQTALADEVSKGGATLHLPVSIVPDLGRFVVSGAASNSDGTAHFSFSVLPTTYAYRAGKVFQYLDKPVHVNTRQWPALGFVTADPHVDVDPATWVVVVELISARFSLLVPLIVQDMLDSAAARFKAGIEAADPFTPIPRVQRRPPDTPGGAIVRIELAEYDITPAGTYIGIKITPEAPPGALIGLTSIPADLQASSLSYQVRMPLGIGADDPELSIRWTVIDPATGNPLVTEDGLADGRETFSFVPEQLGPGLSHLRVTVRVYRALGPNITDLLNDGITLAIRGSLPHGAYTRWRYDVKNPQVRFDDQSQAWAYAGDVVVKRHSRIHRTDQDHCKFFDRQSRYAYETDVFDALPFPVKDILLNRFQLCDYCFFGGPAGLRPAL